MKKCSSRIAQLAVSAGLGLAGLAAGAIVLAEGTALAQSGLLLEAATLPTQVRTALQADIAAARTKDADAFAVVDEVTRNAGLLDQGRRGRFFPYSRPFRALGARGVLPLIEVVAFQAPPTGELRGEAWDALRGSALQALGESRDPRARPVIEAVLRSGEPSFMVIKAAASALGEFADDAAAELLVGLAASPGPMREAVVAGMGQCNRAMVAHALASELRVFPQGPHAKNVVDALADVGNAWAWQTSQVRVHAAEELEVQTAATMALLDALPHYGEYMRAQIRAALFVVNHPDVLVEIEARKVQHAANPVVLGELERLSLDIKSRPVR